jgi:hypothetical protein
MSALVIETPASPPVRRIRTSVPDRGFDARAIWLIDIENEVGGPGAPMEVVRNVVQKLFGGVPRTHRDHIVVGSSSFFAKRVWFEMPQNVQRVLRDGEDGGELALIETFDVEWTAQRFGRLVIASGDHKFVETAIEARIRGMHVHQVTGLGKPAWSLLNTADTHSRLRLGQPGLGTWRKAIAA